MSAMPHERLSAAPESAAALPELETARLRLRQFGPGDLDAFARVTGDPEVMRYIAAGCAISRAETADSLRRIAEAFRRRGFGKWALVRKADGRMIGYCGLASSFEDVGVELAYMLARDCWGRGLVAEASRATLRYGFEQMGLGSIAALTKAGNDRSRRVLEKLGMSFVKRGRYHGYDCVHYALRREEFDAGVGLYRLTHASAADAYADAPGAPN